MAEVIQERVEDRLPELEQLERTGLFSHAEIKAIIRKALELEYRIQRRSLLKDDFIRYVQYEINLLDLIEKRRAVSRFSESWKKYSINMTLELGFGKQLALIIVWWCAHNDIFKFICHL